jgi:hypothetical protein
MTEEPSVDVEELVAELKERALRERAEGGYADAEEVARAPLGRASPEPGAGTLAGGFDLGSAGSRIRFRPELGFSSKPVLGPIITGVKKLNLRLLLYVLDDLARQADAAVLRLEAAVAAEAAAREQAFERLERELRALSERVAALEEPAGPPS